MSKLGFRVICGEEESSHYFGGDTWKLPICPQCNEQAHQIFTFDLNDLRLEELKTTELRELPLINCLNCSLYEDIQNFKINIMERSIHTITQSEMFDWKYELIDKIPVPLPKYDMKLVTMENYDVPYDEDENDQAFDAMGRDYICRILGAPLYIEDSIEATCPCCSKSMSYVAMLTGEDYGNEGGLTGGITFQIGESFLYFYLCKECLIIQTSMQST
ncbi:hypothetical protein OCF68_16220 [Bacillus cereus]|nr:hypothetical protein [Bacillus cereus]